MLSSRTSDIVSSGIGRPMMPVCRIQPQLNLQRGMISSLPVQHHVVDGAFPAHNDLIERCALDPFACCGCSGRMRPSELEIGTELHQLLPLSLTQRRWFPCHDCRDLAFAVMPTAAARRRIMRQGTENQPMRAQLLWPEMPNARWPSDPAASSVPLKPRKGMRVRPNPDYECWPPTRGFPRIHF
jgi:hypothetical protein